jgi:hypothetical protein
MKQLRPSNYTNTPPGGWHYIVPETSQVIRTGGGKSNLLDDVRRYYTANDLLPPTDLSDKIDHFTCQRVPQWCRFEDGSTPLTSATASISFGQAKQGTATLLNWLIKHGRKKVSASEATARASTCVNCPYMVSILGCKSCHAGMLNEVINKVVSGGSTVHDAALQGCAVCGCALKAKIWLPFEAIEPYITESQWNKFADNPRCWMNQHHTDTEHHA